MDLVKTPRAQTLGSEWRRWDLHIHSPASIVNHYPGQDPWDSFLADLAALPPELSVIGINDYIFVDGYKRVLNELKAGALPNIEAVFPVIELRIDQLVGTSGHLNKINLHVIFEPGFDPDVIAAQFVHGLSASFHLDAERPNAKTWSGFPSRKTIEALGSSIKVSLPPQRLSEHNESDLELGFNNLALSLQSVRQVLDGPLFKTKHLIAVGKAEWASLAWNDKSIALKKDVINRAHAVFVASESPQAYLRALDSLKKAEVNSRLLDCSDAHFLSTSSNKDRIGNCFTWINADPTLEGLKHALTEFDHRVFVGNEPTKLSSIRLHPGSHIRKVEIRKNPEVEGNPLFEVALDLNPGFVAVTGNKGQGKSALLDCIGLAANSSRERHFTFLSTERFRNPRANRSLEYEVTLEWSSHEQITKNLAEAAVSTSPERATYLPQQLIDDICSSDPGEPSERFARELSAVLFAHVPDADRLGTKSLETLIGLRSQAIEEKADVLRGELSRINRSIASLEREGRNDRLLSLKAELAVLEASLTQLYEVEPEIPKPPKEDDDPSLAPVRAQIGQHEQERDALLARLADMAKEDAQLAVDLDAAAQLRTGLETLKRQVSSFVETNRARTKELGIGIEDLVTVKFNEELLIRVTGPRITRRSEIEAATDALRPGSVAFELERTFQTIRDLQAQLDEPSRNHAVKLQERAQWEASRQELLDGSDDRRGIQTVESLIEEFREIPQRIAVLNEQRERKLKEIHGILSDQVRIYEELYQPARKFIENHALASKCALEFGAELRERGLEAKFWDILGRKVATTFAGIEEGSLALRKLIDATDFSDVDSVARFARQLDEAIHEDRRGRITEKVDPDKAIRAGHSLEELYDLIFGLSYLEPYYHLASQGISIDRLSPGQKGTLLLMFYLLVDPSRQPLLLDQPDENLDNATIMDLLVPAIKEAKERRQVLVVTHNPNVAVVADADQVVRAFFDGSEYSLHQDSRLRPSPEIQQDLITL